MIALAVGIVSTGVARSTVKSAGVLVTLLPWLTGMSGLIYLAAALVLNGAFLWYAIALKITTRTELPMKVFRFSVQYLMWLFIALLVDHYVPIRLL